MRLRLLLIVASLCILQLGHASKIDSLLQIVNTGQDTMQVKALLKLADAYRTNDLDSSNYYLKKARENLDRMKGNFDNGLIDRYEGFYHQHKGIQLHNIDNYDSALYHYNLAYKSYTQFNLIDKQAQILNNIGAIYESKGDFSKALDYYYRLLRIADSASLKMQKSRAHLNIGVVYLNQQKFEESLKFFNKALPLKKELEDKRGEALVYNNIGIVYYYLGQYDKVLKNFKRSLNIYRQLNDLRSQAMPYFNIAEIYYEQGELKEALYYYKKSYEIDKQLNNHSGQAYSLLAIGNVYKDLKKYRDAIRVQKTAVDILEKIGAQHDLANALLELSYSYEVQGSYQKALKHYKQHKRVLDSVFNLRKETQIAKIKEQYESEQKDQEIALLKKQNRLAELENKQKEEKVLSRQRIAIMSLAIAALVLFALVMIFRLYRQKKLSNQMLEFKNEAIQRKNHEASQALQQLESTLANLQGFLSNITKEFRAPISILTGFSKLILRNPNNETAERYLKQINRSSTRLNRKLGDLTAAVEFEAGEFTIKKQGVEVADIASYLINTYDSFAKLRKVELSCSIDQACPDIVEVDPVKYFQVLTNLLDNAIRFTLPGEKVDVKFQYEKPNHLKVKILDSGMGITEDKKERIYSFFQDSDASIFKNAAEFGLGLSIVKMILEAFEGKIFIDSQPGMGTEFTVSIPAEMVDKKTFEFKSITHYLFDHSTKHIKVLIAEESSNIADEIETMLTYYAGSMQVKKVANFDEANEELEQTNYNLILFDLNNHQMDFPEKVSKLRRISRNQNLKVMALANEITGDLSKRCRNTGIESLMEKPVEPDKLIIEMERISNNDPIQEIISIINAFDNSANTGINNTDADTLHENGIQEKVIKLNVAIRQKEWQKVLEYVNLIRTENAEFLSREMVQQLNTIERECVTTQNIEIMIGSLDAFQLEVPH